MTRRIGQFAAAGLLAVATSTTLGWFAPGANNGWDTNAAMTETFAGSGIWQYTASGLAAGARTEWNLIATAGDWGSQAYGSNQWGYADGAGDVTITIDTNTYADGWLPATNRISTNTAGSLGFAVTGNFQAAAGLGGDWDIGAAPAMVSGGGSILQYSLTGLPAGTYDWKPVHLGPSGEWDTVTADSSSTVAGGNNQFSVAGPADVVIMQMDYGNGTVRVIPTPGALALVGVSGLAATRRRRR